MYKTIFIIAIILAILTLVESMFSMRSIQYSGRAMLKKKKKKKKSSRWDEHEEELNLQAREADPVLLGASAPYAVRPGDEFTARFVAYVAQLEQQVESQLRRLAPHSESHLGIKSCRWQLGTRVKVKLYGNNFHVASAEEEFIWEGNCNLVDFDVTIPDLAPEGITVLRFDVLIDDVAVAKLRLDLEISSSAANTSIRAVKAEPFRTAFASYASNDRLRVLDRVSEISRNGVDVFLDCLSLHPGEEWKPRLEMEIKDRELFLLFWSIHAKNSEWVTWEWRTALQHKGVSGIDLHPLGPVFEASPPEELKDLHFGDSYMLARKAYEEREPHS
jgi:hypothetical protein